MDNAEATSVLDAPVIDTPMSGVIAGKPKYLTRDLDFVAFLLSQIMYMVLPVEDRRATPVDARVRLADLVPYSDKDATSASKSIRYTFVLQSKDIDETEEQLRDRMRRIELAFLNKQMLAEPVGYGAWRRQLRAWMLETDSRRRAMVENISRRAR